MRLSKETKIKLPKGDAIVVSKMCYAASKLWNICNYERRNYGELGLEQCPDWYYQKSSHKADYWFKCLPSQTAQEVCKVLDKSWKSFYALLKSGGVTNPRPPRFKHDGIPITYMQKGILRMSDGKWRLSIPKLMKEHVLSAYGIHVDYLYLGNVVFQSMNDIKQIKLYPPDKDGVCRVIIVYEEAVPQVLPDNGRYLSVDLGINNPFTCYDNASGKSFILGHLYGSISQYYDKQIAHYGSISASQQAACGIKYPKASHRVLGLYRRKRNTLKDYLHKCTRYIVNYCVENNINTLVVGDITGIREGKDLGHVTNQKLHAFPYAQIYQMLEYKCVLYGINFIMVDEAYSSQCSPRSESVDKEHGSKSNRIKRGLYKEWSSVWNADSVGAYNILRIFFQLNGRTYADDYMCKGLSSPKYIKVAV